MVVRLFGQNPGETAPGSVRLYDTPIAPATAAVLPQVKNPSFLLTGNNFTPPTPVQTLVPPTNVAGLGQPTPFIQNPGILTQMVDPAEMIRATIDQSKVKPKSDSVLDSTVALGGTLLNIPAQTLQNFILGPIESLALTGAEIYQNRGAGKPGAEQGISIKVPGFFGAKGTEVSGSQAMYANQINQGVPHEEALANTFIQTGMNIAVALPLARAVTKVGFAKYNPRALLEAVEITRRDVIDIVSGRAPVSPEIRAAFTNLSPEMKSAVARGLVEIVQNPTPSLLGKILGVSQAEAEMLFQQVMKARTPLVPETRQLPGTAISGQPVKGGLAIQPVRKVGGIDAPYWIDNVTYAPGKATPKDIELKYSKELTGSLMGDINGNGVSYPRAFDIYYKGEKVGFVGYQKLYKMNDTGQNFFQISEIQIDDAFKRKGIATAVYDSIVRKTGLDYSPSGIRSVEEGGVGLSDFYHDRRLAAMKGKNFLDTPSVFDPETIAAKVKLHDPNELWRDRGNVLTADGVRRNFDAYFWYINNGKVIPVKASDLTAARGGVSIAEVPAIGMSPKDNGLYIEEIAPSDLYSTKKAAQLKLDSGFLDTPSEEIPQVPMTKEQRLATLEEMITTNAEEYATMNSAFSGLEKFAIKTQSGLELPELNSGLSRRIRELPLGVLQKTNSKAYFRRTADMMDFGPFEQYGVTDYESLRDAFNAYQRAKLGIRRLKQELKAVRAEKPSETQQWLDDLGAQIKYELSRKRYSVVQRAKQEMAAVMRGTKIGEKIGAKITREELIQRFRETEVDREMMRQEVLNYITEIVPASQRGQFLDMAAHATTMRRMFSAFSRADQLAIKYNKRKIISEIKEMRIPKKGDRTIAVDYQKKLQALFADVDFSKPTEGTVRRLSALKEYLALHPDLAKSHPELARSVQRLSKQNLADMPLSDLQELKVAIDTLINQGKLKAALQNKYDEAVRERNLNKLIASTKNRDVKMSDPANPSYTERRRMELQNAYVQSTHTPRVADWLDNFKGYTGENAKYVRDIGAAETLAHDTANMLMHDALSEMQAAGMPEIGPESSRNIMIDLLDKQGAVTQVQTLLDNNGLTGIPQLTPIEMKVADILRKYAGMYTAEIAAVYEELENLPFQAVKNYFPIKYSSDFNKPPSELIKQSRHRRGSVDEGLVEARKEGVKLSPRTDVIAILDEAMKEQQRYIHTQPELENIRALVGTPEYLEAAGSVGTTFWLDYLDVVARNGWSATANAAPWLRERRINLNNAILGYKVGTFLMQPFAIFDGLASTQAQFGSIAALRVLKEFLGAWIIPGRAKKLISESPALRHRQGGELAIAENFDRVKNSHGLWAKFKEKGMSLIRFTDVRTAAGVQKGIQDVLEAAGDKNALQQAEFYMNLYQGSADVAYRPLIYSSGEMARTWFTFQTFMMNRWGILVNDIVRAGFIGGDAKKKFNALIAFGILLAGMIGEQEARKKIAKLIQGKDTGESLSMEAITAIPELIPFFGNIISSIQFSGQADIEAPLMGVFENLGTGLWSLATGKKKKTKIKGLLKALEAVATMEFGVPGAGQAADILERVFGLNKTGGSAGSNYNSKTFKSGTDRFKGGLQ